MEKEHAYKRLGDILHTFLVYTHVAFVKLNLKVKLSVSTSNCARLIIYEQKISPLKLGAHEVQICVANNCSQPGTVNISCTFSENSRATGFLSVLSSETNTSQEMFVVAN